MFVVQPTLPQWQWGRPSPPCHLTRRKLVIRGMIPSRHWGESIEREVIWIPGTSIFVLYFWASTLQNKALSNKKILGHWVPGMDMGKTRPASNLSKFTMLSNMSVMLTDTHLELGSFDNQVFMTQNTHFWCCILGGLVYFSLDASVFFVQDTSRQTPCGDGLTTPPCRQTWPWGGGLHISFPFQEGIVATKK